MARRLSCQQQAIRCRPLHTRARAWCLPLKRTTMTLNELQRGKSQLVTLQKQHVIMSSSFYCLSDRAS